jgi:mannosyltransferase
LKDRSALTVVVLLVLITVLAVGLRLYRLDAQSLWYDEGFSVSLARLGPAEITARTAADIQPPLYYYLLHGWIGFLGDDERAVRSLSVLFGVVTVPLIYAVAWQLFRSRLAGLLAALLIAVSPLHIWYGQETRMYTLLTFLCLLSSYFLLLVIQTEKKWQILALWAAYTLTNVAAMYTHYFAFFVLAFQAGYLFFVWWGRGFRPLQLIVGGLASGAAIVLAYLPWLPYLLTRYSADTSYLPGYLKLPEALLDIGLSFVGGESVIEPVGIFLVFGCILVLILCLAALLIHASYHPEPGEGRNMPGQVWRGTQQSSDEHLLPTTYYPLLFLLLYLLLPPALILALSYNAPKFNARYTMVSHPAFLLILAGGLSALWPGRSGLVGNLVRRVLAAVALVFVLGVSAYADYNAYTNPGVERADFRSVARYIRKHIAPDETVILSAGHMFPVFDYYAPGVERHLLPDSPTLDTTQTLDYSIASDLNDWLANRGGVWVVLWQNEIVDPVGYLTTLLDDVGQEQPVQRSFAQIDLRHYRFPIGVKFPDRPAIAHPADFNFGNQLHLLGYTQNGDRQVTLFWQALQQLDQDYRVSLTLRDPAGQGWGQWDGRPTSYLYPTNRWRAGQIVFGRYDLDLIPGAPPGDYGLEVGVYTEDEPAGLDVLDAAGAPQGKRAMLGAVQLSVPAATAEEVEVPNPVQIDLGGGLTVIGWALERNEAQPGDRLSLALIWSVESQPQGDYHVHLLVTDAAGQTLDAGTFPPTNIWHPTSIWLPGQAWRGQSTFRLPIQAQPGDAHLAIQLVDANGTALGAPADLASIQVLPTSRTFTPPRPQAPRQANFDDKATLLGADLAPGPVSASGVLPVTLYWQAMADMDIPYTVFVHLIGADGQVVAGHDGEPAGGARPTISWVPGEFITDRHEVALPADLPAGNYVVEVGLYDAGAPGMPRVPILGAEGQVETDRVIFGPVQVTK